MSSYFDFYCKSSNNNSTESPEQIRGTCYSMCPQTEIELRVRENMVHVLEVSGSARQLVKSYSRSAADSNMAVPRLLRPYSTLKDTVRYLLLEILKRHDVSMLKLYDFVNDRLRAVRQDMTIQRLPPEECASLLEPMVRFYVYYGCKLRNYPISDYDPVLNKKYLMESLKWFLCCCDRLEKIVDNKDLEALNTFMSKLDIGEKRLSYDRALMESIYILCNLDDAHPLLRFLELTEELKSNPKLEAAFKIGVAHLKGNYVVVFRLIEKLCPLSYCAVCPYLPKLQRHALQVLVHAYSSKQLSVASAALRRWLRLGSAREAAALCAHYGLGAGGAGAGAGAGAGSCVRLSKGDFDASKPLHQLETNLIQEEKLNQLEDIFVTCN